MKNPVTLLILALLIAGALAIFLLNRERTTPPVTDETVEVPEVAPGPPEAPVPAGSAVPVVPEGGVEEGEPDLQEAPPDAGAESAPLPRGYPRSQVPHRVAKVWGRNDDGSAKRVVGMTIVVDPSASAAELSELADDVLKANCDAPRMSVRIYDSEEALDPEAHKNHDPLIAEHTIGQIWVNPTESRHAPKVRVKVRGKDVLVGAEAMPTGDACDPAS
ncbi:MAG: hypothetical protein Q8R92_12665 [Deltaproteobacteria bacterium]|nr:hypothetical protein [Deltaproteobacteria bacterium]